jgi:hypothetical protein
MAGNRKTAPRSSLCEIHSILRCPDGFAAGASATGYITKWVYAMYLLVTARKGISSMQLAKEIGITQKSAWFVLQHLRVAMSCPGS